MKVTRKFTTAGQDPFASVRWVKRTSKITNPDGTVVFQMDDAEAPETWSQLAVDIMVSKYFRRAGIPVRDEQGNTVVKDGKPVTTGEKSARQVIHRLAGCWRHWGEKHGYFDTPNDAAAFYDELVYMMVHQVAAPNSPQWFNTGLNWAYGITGPAQGHFVPDPKTGKVSLAHDAYTHPQPHACFIQSINDDLVNPGGIMDLWTREARLFKYGSGTGTNFSKLRAENEKLSGGGKSSGLMSWLKIGDRAAGAIKSGGTTRRAAKMVCLDMDHPDIETFINWKVREEIKVAAMVEGLKHLSKEQQEAAKKLNLKLDYDFNGEAYQTVSGQNSNNSVRIPDEFFQALEKDGEWKTYYRTSDKAAKTFKARELWDDIGYAAWRCADPGVQFDSTINAWHTCPSGGRINASNPCSEYMFLDNTACNLASINVLRFYDAKSRMFDILGFEHAVDLWTIVLEVSVLMAAYPSEEVARLSYKYRTLGLGYANLGAMLMQAGIAYDSEAARAVCGCISAILTGRSYRESALMASKLGAFTGFADDKDNMRRVVRNHARAARGIPRDSGQYEDLKIAPVPINHEVIHAGINAGVTIANADELLEHAVRAWDDAVAAGEKSGYRNAQTTVIAPTGTIGLLMDCDTTGIEPDFALVKFKKLAGGGYFKIANASVKPALEALGYTDSQVRDILAYLLGRLTLDVPVPPPHSRASSSWCRRGTLHPGGILPRLAALQGSVEGRPGQGHRRAAGRVRAVLRVRAVVDGRRGAQPRGRRSGPGESQPQVQPARAPGPLPGPDRVAQRGDLRHADRRGRAAPQARAPARLRLRQQVRQARRALHRAPGAHPHDGRGPAVHLRRHQQDHQPPQRGDGRGHQGVLHDVVAAGAQGQRPVPRRVQAQPAAEHDLRQREGRGESRGIRKKSCGLGIGGCQDCGGDACSIYPNP